MTYYQVAVQYKTLAENETEAWEKAKQVVLEQGERSITPIDNKAGINNPAQVYDLLKFMRNKHKEYMVALFLDVRGRLITKEVISIGILNASMAHPREVFEAAIRNHAASLVLAHNHPSGDTEPSTDDLEITARLITAGGVLGIKVQDHVIIGKHSYTSFREKGLL